MINKFMGMDMKGLHTCGGEHKTDLHHLGLPLSQMHKVQGLGPGT